MTLANYVAKFYYITMGKETQESVVAEFIDKKTLNALADFLAADSVEVCTSQINSLAEEFGAAGVAFSNQTKGEDKKLVVSFKNNLLLLIQKTWVEKSDVELKDRVLYQIEQFCKSDELIWQEVYVPFLDMIHDAVFLMFGQQTKSPDFVEWTFRIDPEFGIFWWYISSLPHDKVWQDDKCRIAILLGMYFLANY